MKTYGQESFDKLANRYESKGGTVHIINEGSLLNGLTLMYGDGLKTAVVKEVYLNSQSSAYKVRLYNKLPKKYQWLKDNISEGETIQEVLEDLRQSIEDENISYGEIALLTDLAEYIESGDVQLLQWAGVPEVVGA